MNDNLELELQAWLDGEGPAPEAQSFDRELMAQLQAVKGALAGNEMARSVPETREFYWSKIEREIQRQAPAPRQAFWPRWLAPLAGFGALACLLVLAANPFAPAAFDEASSAGEGMEAITFHDRSAGMTVVWVTGSAQAEPDQSPGIKTPNAADSEPKVD
jgi:hypothetical protein